MRKKDYMLIAKGLQAFMMASWRHDDPLYKKLCETMAMALSSEPKFDRQKFLTACGIEVSDVR